jgi:hypothetical protein
MQNRGAVSVGIRTMMRSLGALILARLLPGSTEPLCRRPPCTRLAE